MMTSLRGAVEDRIRRFGVMRAIVVGLTSLAAVSVIVASVGLIGMVLALI